MRAIDADALEPDADYDDGEYWAYSVTQIENAPTIEPDWTELMVICDNCGHAIHAKRENCKVTSVQTERTGKWIWMGDAGDSRFMCSVCKWKENVPTAMGKPNIWSFCPSCGARMEEQE